MKKFNRKGFSLVELLISIGIICILFSISSFVVYNIINNSKENAKTLAINNIKTSTEVYIKEYNHEISWDENNEVCIPVQTLVSKGYLKKDILENENIPLSIVVTRDEYNSIIHEKELYVDCEAYLKTVSIPTSDDICNNFTYDGDNHFLINQSIPMNDYSSIEYKNTTYQNTNDVSYHPKDAGEYKVSINLVDGKRWEDNTIESKTVTCKIKKATPILSLDLYGNNDTEENLGTKEVNLKSNVDGTILLETSNKSYVTAKFKDDNKIKTGINKIIEVTTLASRKSPTSITMTVIPNEEYQNNYTEASITYTVGKVTNIFVEKPTSQLCNNLTYDGNEHTLVSSTEEYQLINNYAIEIGSYAVRARLKYGYIWSDNTTDDVEFSCVIKTPTPIITYKNAVCNPQQFTVTYNKPYGENQSLCSPNITGYTFVNWYSDNKFVNKVTNDTIVANFKNHNLYAKQTAHTYTIDYKCNGGTGSTASSFHTYDVSKNLTSNSCTRNGYAFNGWNTASDGSGTSYTNNQSVINLTSENNKTITLYAQWTRVCPYNINHKWTYNYNKKTQQISVPCSGLYTFEAYGAAGVSYGNNPGGYGGKTKATFTLEAGDVINIYTGSTGSGTNGGSNAIGHNGGNGTGNSAGGGASTVIILTRNANTYTLLEAGGGGGANNNSGGSPGGTTTISTDGKTGGTGFGGGGGGYVAGASGATLVQEDPFVWIPDMSAENKEFKIDTSMVSGQYTKTSGVSGSFGYVEKVDGIYSYMQLLKSGAINENFTGYASVSKGQVVQYRSVMDVHLDADYDPNKSYVKVIDQKNNILYKLTLGQIANGYDLGTINHSYKILGQDHSGRKKYDYNFNITYTVPDGVSKIGVVQHVVSVTPDSGGAWNSGIYVPYFGVINAGYKSSGGSSYINSNFSVTNTLTESGVNANNGYATITLVSN